MRKRLRDLLMFGILLGSSIVFNPAIALSSGEKQETTTISVFVEGYAGRSVLSSIRDITWIGYRAYAVEEGYTPNKTLVAQFTEVPRGEFSIFLVVDGCIGKRTGSFLTVNYETLSVDNF